MSAAGSTKQSTLQLRSLWILAQPDCHKCSRKIVSRNRALHSAIDVDLHPTAGRSDEAHPFTGFHVCHPTVQLPESFLQRWRVPRRIVGKSLLSTLPELICPHRTYELQDELARGVRCENRSRITRRLDQIQRDDVDVDPEHGCFPHTQPIQLHWSTLSFYLVWKLDACTLLPVCGGDTHRNHNSRQRQLELHSKGVSGGTAPREIRSALVIPGDDAAPQTRRDKRPAARWPRRSHQWSVRQRPLFRCG